MRSLIQSISQPFNSLLKKKPAVPMQSVEPKPTVAPMQSMQMQSPVVRPPIPTVGGMSREQNMSREVMSQNVQPRPVAPVAPVTSQSYTAPVVPKTETPTVPKIEPGASMINSEAPDFATAQPQTQRFTLRNAAGASMDFATKEERDNYYNQNKQYWNPPEGTVPQTGVEADYQRNLEITPEEMNAQAELDTLNESYRSGYQDIRSQAIPMAFITGQSRELEARKLGLAEPLEAKLSRLQAKRTSALAASKFALERADKQKENADKTVTLSEGETVGRVGDKGFEGLYTAPKTSAGSGLEKVGPGETLYDPTTGESVYQSPFKPAAPNFQTIGGETYRVDESGNLTRLPENDAKKITTAQNIVEVLGRMVSPEGKMINGSHAVGFPGPGAIWPGSKTQTFIQDYDTLKSMLTLENMGVMKGVLSDSDMKIIRNASASLTRMMSEDEFANRLKIISTTMTNAIARYNQALGQTAAPQAPAPQAGDAGTSDFDNW